jgi:hypothetical protein
MELFCLTDWNWMTGLSNIRPGMVGPARNLWSNNHAK